MDKSIQENGSQIMNIEELGEYEQKYLKEEGLKVEKLSEEKFQPALTNLKKLIASIEIK